MNAKKRKKIFLRFLKENNCYTQFCENFYDYQVNEKHREYDIDKFIEDNVKHSSSQEINFAFCWINTKQGHDYWNNINVKWKNFNVKKK